MKFFKKLLGDNLYLSPQNAEEEIIEKFTEWLNDFETTDYTGKSPVLITSEGERKWFENPKQGDYTFFIVRLEDDKLIGTIGLHDIDHINRRATFGIFIGDKSVRNKGYGTEAINLLLDFAFNYLNLNSVNLTVLDVNERAKRCYEKVGFKEFGRQRKCKFVNGKYYDIIHMDILKEEFKQSYIKNKNV